MIKNFESVTIWLSKIYSCNEGKLEPRGRKSIFMSCGIGVKRYKA